MSITVILTQGKVTFYKLYLISGSLEGHQLTVNSALDKARNMINTYQERYNASYCKGFDRLVPLTMQTGNKRIENQTVSLSVQVENDTLKPLNYVELNWYNKIGDIIVPAQSIEATFAETGVLTSFVDNLCLYQVATTEIALSKETALAIGMRIINAYASENGRKIASIQSNLSYVSDINATRGDRFLIYPQWQISARFDDLLDDICGYSVCIWADTGDVRSQVADGIRQNAIENGPLNQYLVAVIAVAVFGLVGLTAFVKRQTRILKIHGVTVTVGITLLICSLLLPFFAQPSFAYPSSTYGSTYGFSDQTEINLHNQITQEISSMASETSYTDYTYNGQDLTRQNIYLGANDHGDNTGIVYYVGHGSTSGTTMYANNPYDHDITSQQIYDNSYQHSIYARFVYLDACDLADSKNYMPYAWLHTTSISSDGYQSPDNTLKCFVGWVGSAPYLMNSVDGQSCAGYWFVYYFYEGALTLGLNVNAALDYASEQLWQIDFDDGSNKFYTGWIIWYPYTVFGHIVVYGQGTLYLGNEAYVQDYVDFDAGTSPFAWVVNPTSLEGPQDDGYSTRLLAGWPGDYSWITGRLQREATGYVYLWGYSDSQERSHLTVFISDNYNNWSTLYDGFIDSGSPGAIYLGYASNQFRYIGFAVQNDQYSSDMYIDAVHVHA